ncbi:MAG TPA: hypothetical protein VGN80_14475 [Devosiaceae bacterium]|nr:hypothetical protein [Devosiaceae bacterium]
MPDWISQNVEVLSLLVSLGMLAVWIIYLQVFLYSYRRQTRSKIVINRGAGVDLEARCLVSNMSSDAIYVESILASVEAHEDSWWCTVTDIESRGEVELPSDPKALTHQGPLASGDYMDIGSYRELLERAVDGRGRLEAVLEKMAGPIIAQIQVVADYASDDLLVGARRRFQLEVKDQRWLLEPQDGGTQQIRSRRERRRISEDLSRQTSGA